MAAAKIEIARGLNVRQTEALVQRGEQKPVAAKPADPEVAALERELSTRLGLKVQITQEGRGGERLHRVSQSGSVGRGVGVVATGLGRRSLLRSSPRVGGLSVAGGGGEEEGVDAEDARALAPLGVVVGVEQELDRGGGGGARRLSCISWSSWPGPQLA